MGNWYITTDSEEQYHLAHYGVLGMKWGVRHAPEKAYEKASKKAKKFDKKINKYSDKARKSFGKAAKVDSRIALFRNDAKAEKFYNKSRRLTAKAVRQAEKGARWIKRMEKEFSKQSVVKIDKSITDLGQSYVDRITSMSDRAYVNSIRR